MLKRIGTNGPLVIGLALSVVAGLLFYFYTKPAYLSLLVGLLATIIALLVDIVYRIERESALRSQLDSIPWLRSYVEEIARSLDAISTQRRLIPFIDYARRDIGHCAHTVAGMAGGQMRASVGDDVLVRQTDLAQRIIRACSVQRLDMPRWLSGVGTRYWESNLRALDRKVRIERVFIYEDWTADLERIVNQQANAGVHVWTVESRFADPRLRINMAAWDDSFTYHFDLNSEGDPVENIYSVNEVDIARRIDQIELLKSVGNPYIASPGIVTALDPSQIKRAQPDGES
jgi:hypothetical protein